MKLSKLIFPVLALGLIGSAGAAIALRGSAAKETKAIVNADTITDNQYDAAIFESYGEDSNQWKADKQLGAN